MMNPFTHRWPIRHLLSEAHPRPVRHALTECLLLALPLHVPIADDLRHHRNSHFHMLLWHHYLLHHLWRLHPIAHRRPVRHTLHHLWRLHPIHCTANSMTAMMFMMVVMMFMMVVMVAVVGRWCCIGRGPVRHTLTNCMLLLLRIHGHRHLP